MHPIHYRSKHHLRGSVLALLMIVLLLLSVGSLTAMQLGRDAHLRAIDNSRDITARYAAEAGVAAALHRMNRYLGRGLMSYILIPSFRSEPLAGTTADYSVSVTGSLDAGYTLTSTGQAGQAERSIRATARLVNPFALGYAVLARNNITLGNRTTVAGYNSAHPSQHGLRGNLGTFSDQDDAVRLGNNAEIHGDIYIGPDGAPDAVISAHNRSTVHGAYFRDHFPPPMTPVSAPWMFPRGRITGSHVILTALHSGTYSGIEIANNGALVIAGHCTLVVTGDILLRNRAAIHIYHNGSLTLYLNGNLDAENGDGIRNDTHNPLTFTLYGTGQAQTINLNNSTHFHGAVYAPNADMTLDNRNNNTFGAFIVNNFELKNNGTLYYDTVLKQVGIMDNLAWFKIDQWEEF